MKTKEKLVWNAKEEALLGAFGEVGAKLTISELAVKAFAKKGSGSQTKGNSWVRNSLRRLVRAGLVKKRARGTYELVKAPAEEAQAA